MWSRQVTMRQHRNVPERTFLWAVEFEHQAACCQRSFLTLKKSSSSFHLGHGCIFKVRMSGGNSKAEKDDSTVAKLSWTVVMVEKVAAHARGTGVTKNHDWRFGLKL